MPKTFSRLFIQLNFKKLHQALLWIFSLNLFFLFGTWLHDHSWIARWPNSVRRVTGQLNLGNENVAASWYSSMILFLVALAAGLCFLADNQRLKSSRDKVFNLGWIVFLMIFTTLSFDEMGSFHEVIGDSEIFESIGKGKSGGGWYIFYLLIAIVGIFMMLFFLLKFFRNWRSLIFAVIGVLLFLSNPIQEDFEIDAMRQASNPATWRRPVGYLLLEEGSEIFASFSLLFSFAIYLRSSVLKFCALTSRRPALELPTRRRVLALSIFVIAIITMVMVAVHLLLPDQRLSGSGIPGNWFPAAIAFYSFLVALYFLFTAQMDNRMYWSLVATVFVCGLMSLFFGANLYDFRDWLFRGLEFLLFTATICFGILMTLKFDRVGAKLASAAGAAIGIGCFFADNHSLPLAGYFLFACFLYAVAENFTASRFPAFNYPHSPR